jgi:glutathione synthase/RimK-type ligase-like ATP-grasp enzyme
VMTAQGIPTPRTAVIDGARRLPGVMDRLGLPIVLKIPNASFSRGVFKAKDAKELRDITERLLEESDLIIAQEFMYTTFDWRVGVLEGEPLFVCQYMMARNHWQIVKHDQRGRAQEGGFRTLAVEDAPKEVVDIAVRAARQIGDGLYGVDLKQNDRGVFVIEVNDNPNLDHGIEDQVLKDELWRRLVRWFQKRLE